MTTEIKIPDTRRWFERVTPCKNLNLERKIEFADMSEINAAWGKKKNMDIAIEKDNDKG